jgi:hypothetical protein
VGYPGERELTSKKGGLKWIGKPDSVVAPNTSHSDHSSCPLIAQEVERPYPRAMGGTTQPSYLVLLQVGFAMRSLSLANR